MCIRDRSNDDDEGLLAAAVRAVNREFVYIENSSLGAKLAKFDRQLSPNLAHLGATWRQHRLQEASKWSSTGGPDRIWGHLGAKRAPKSSTPKNGDHFPAKCAPNYGFSQSK